MIENIIKSVLSRSDKSNFGVKEKIFFFRELAYLLDGGVSIYDGIKIVSESSDNFALKDITKQCLQTLDSGKTFSLCLAKQSEYFNQGDINIIRSGEKGGNLNLVLRSLSNEYSYINSIKNKYISAMIYPVILLVVSVFAVLLLFLYILPGVFDIVKQFDGVKLPLMTQILMDFTNGLKIYGALIGWIMLGIVTVLGLFMSTESGKKVMFSILLEVPVIGKMTKYFYVIQLARYMKIMLTAGMNYVETFSLLRKIMTVGMYQDMLDRVLVGLHQGSRIYDTMKYEISLIPPNVSLLIKVGEETANLKASLENVIAMYEEDLDNLLQNLSKFIEPIMILFVGGVICVVALSVFGIIGTILDGLQVF